MAEALKKPTPMASGDPGLSSNPGHLRRLHARDPQPERAVIERVRREFDEMRGFSPTRNQAARLFGLTSDECDRVLGALAKEGFLYLSHDGRYRVTR